MNITKKVTKVFVAIFVMISMFPMMNLVINAEDNTQTRSTAAGPTVATVGGKTYGTLKEAIDDAPSGSTIELNMDTFISPIAIRDKSITLELNGHKVYAGTSMNDYSKTGFGIFGSSSLTVEDHSNQQSGLIKGNVVALVVEQGEFTLNSGTIEGVDFAISGNADPTYGAQTTKININGGRILQNNPKDFETSAIYNPQGGTVNISGGYIEGSVGVQLCSGSLTTVNISGGKVVGTGPNNIENKVGSGPIGDGAAISIINRDYPDGAPSVRISGGTYESRQSKALLAYTFKASSTPKESEWVQAKDKVIIQGGKFSSSPEKYVGTGYKVYNNLLNQFVVAPVATGVTLSSSTLRLEKNNTAQLTAILAPVGAIESVGWKTSNKDVATVEPTGEVTAHGAGTATITATVEGKTASCIVSVYEIKAPVIPPVDKDTNVSLGEEAKEVLKDVVKDVIENVKTSTAISNDTRNKLEAALVAGKEISVAPKVEVKKESAIEKEVVTKIENAMKATTEKDKVAEVAQYYDLSMMLTAAGEPLGTVNELTGKVEFTVSIPKDLTKAGRKFYMVRVHGNGDTERIEGKLDGTDFSFETDKFSIFALVYEDDKVETPTTPEKPETPETPEKPESPAKPTTPTTPEKPGVDTGDVTNAGMLMTMLLAAGFVGFTTLKRRNRI